MPSKKMMQRRRTNSARGRRGVNGKYYLPGDAVALPISSIQVNPEGTRTFTFDFMIDTLAQVVASASVPVLGALSFQLSDVPNYSLWSANFDKFRIDAVELDFVPIFTQISGVTNTSTPMFCTALDFDSAGAPGSLNAVIAYSRSTQTAATTRFKRHFVPRVAREVYLSSITTTYEEGPAHAWMTTTQPSVPHFGLVYGFAVAGAANAFAYKINARYKVTFAFRVV
jgi:hypothetical protein